MAVPNTALSALVQLLHHASSNTLRHGSRKSGESGLADSPEMRTSGTNQPVILDQQHLGSQAHEVLAAHRQPSLLAAVWPVPHGGRCVCCSSCRQQPCLQRDQPWNTQFRAASTSAAAAAAAGGGGSRDRSAAWPSAVPPLHQPHKHVTGTKPLRGRPAEVVSAAAPAPGLTVDTGSQLTAGAMQRESFFVRHRAYVFVAVLFCTTAAAMGLILQELFLGSAVASLGSNDPVVQKTGLRKLDRVLHLRQALGEGVVQELVDRGIIQALVTLVQPGTDALVLINTCEMLQGLLDSPLAVTAMQQAGLSQAVNSALKEGWVPTGALRAVQTLQRAIT